MSDRQMEISAAALKALELGNNDERMIINAFRAHAPKNTRIPSNLSVVGARNLRELIELLANQAEVVTNNGNADLDFPSVVALSKTSNEATFGCSGILISPDIVLTAGHCVHRGFTGGVWLKDLDGERHFLHPDSAKSTKHTNFGKDGDFSNDIGMIRLITPVENVAIHRIADGPTINQATLAVIAGFGQDEGHLISIDIRRAAEAFIMINPSDGTIGFAGLEFVIGNPKVAGDGDACDGDSGGAAFIMIDGEPQLAGLISRGVKPHVCGDGTICLRLDRYTPWIDDTIETLKGQPRPV